MPKSNIDLDVEPVDDRFLFLPRPAIFQLHSRATNRQRAQCQSLDATATRRLARLNELRLDELEQRAVLRFEQPAVAGAARVRRQLDEQQVADFNSHGPAALLSCQRDVRVALQIVTPYDSLKNAPLMYAGDA